MLPTAGNIHIRLLKELSVCMTTTVFYDATL